jgi:hypothetical protein
VAIRLARISDDLKAMLVPYPAVGMTYWPVSTRVGNVKNNDGRASIMLAGGITGRCSWSRRRVHLM